MKYVEQTGRMYKFRFKEHIQDVRNNRHSAKFAQHIPETGHAYNTINQTMEVLHIESKGQELNTLERFEI
jgi:hypothetical protein